MKACTHTQPGITKKDLPYEEWLKAGGQWRVDGTGRRSESPPKQPSDEAEPSRAAPLNARATPLTAGVKSQRGKNTRQDSTTELAHHAQEEIADPINNNIFSQKGCQGSEPNITLPYEEKEFSEEDGTVVHGHATCTILAHTGTSQRKWTKISRPQTMGMELIEPLSTIEVGQKWQNTMAFENCVETNDDGSKRSKNTGGSYSFILTMVEAGT